MTTVDTAVSAIDAAIGEPGTCYKCGRSLAESPSADFCSENCQNVWRRENVTVPPGHDVLDRVTQFVSRFNIFPSEHCAPMLALWYAHTHAAQHFYVTPRLILSSVEPGSGKTRVLEVAQFLVKAPEMTISATTAALFRMVNDGPITILFDEVDTIFNPKSGGNNEDLRGLLNAGYKRTATIARCVGDAKAMKVQRFPVYAPAALAGLAGNMPDTITTRAITVHMQRRREDEEVEEFWEEEVEAEAAPLRDTLAAWVESVSDKVSKGRPVMPSGVRDRAAEIWRPLIALADAAGGTWPETAREACTHFVAVANADRNGGGLRLQLLSDLRDLFTARGTDKLTSNEIVNALCALDEAPWADLNGKPLDSRRLARELKPYGVESQNVKQANGTVAKGYRVTGPAGLADVWNRYLPTAATSATSATSQVNQVADTGRVADANATAGTG
ncbi:hypothetical protein BAY61_02405 [Prauserella marina]|uniref:Uncharacterized protein n=1 Tax=Prauserella marina TaxID=530584 RepID=A0A222VJC5_9PSEU|nr:DUF3631 domain-containing protein [Prauserella marina]ASR34029.1 hypothetical protein BAY61_02405 [Prauserella marina]PWV82656.1 uncharacterized protein DUF3631 [Prauserella marina]SDC73980.1 Protein of unknown function [Prauserella marina]